MLLNLNYKKYLIITLFMLLGTYCFFDGVSDFTQSGFIKTISIIFLIYSVSLYCYEEKIKKYLKEKLYDTKSYDLTYESAKSYFEIEGKTVQEKYEPLNNFLALLKNDSKLIVFSILFFSTWENLFNNHFALISLLLFSVAVYGVLRTGKWLVLNYLRVKREHH